jgi:hormone-sensitive lipase
LNDAWDAYVWVVENAERKLGIGGGRIIIAGDSAGGNLSCGVISRAIERGFRVPDGVLLAYPALNLNVQAFTNSYLYALHDLIIPHTFLKLCLNAYVQSAQHDTETDHFLSPIITPNETLAQFPPVRMMVGTHDPLHDDCWRFTERLNDAGVNVHLKVYERMMHGFLNFDL